jgi:hypothetical protein
VQGKKGGVMITDKEKALQDLKRILEQGDRKVYCFLRHVSPSGMSRRISFYSIAKNEPICIDWYIEKIDIGYKRDKHKEGLKVGGCGMDMGFSVVYNLGDVIYPNGDGKTITGRNGDTKPETDGGYLLKHIWL